jgi:hypothetical protein
MSPKLSLTLACLMLTLEIKAELFLQAFSSLDWNSDSQSWSLDLQQNHHLELVRNANSWVLPT